MVASQQAYDEAIRLSQQRLRISDPNIRQGAPDMVTIKAGPHTYQRPWGQNGGYAVVYRYRTQCGELKALRCYRVAMQPEIKERYALLADYFREHLSSVSAGFCFYEEGILVDERVQGALRLVVRPVLLMDWIEGRTLLAAVDDLCRARDREGLRALTREWFALVQVMQRAHMAHGDLSGGNIMLREDGHLVLVDYDGVYIPDFAGRAALVSGVPDYQHPQKQDRPFNERMDSFSIAVISAALLALQANPALWDVYAPRDVAGTLVEDRLLFTIRDFENPDASSLFRELEGTHDPLLYAIVTQLKAACHQPITHLLPPPTSVFLREIEEVCGKGEKEGGEGMLTERERERIEQMVVRERLRYAIACGLERESVQLSQEAEAREPLADQELREGIGEMKRRFVEQFDPQIRGQVNARTSEVCIRWSWPDDELIQHAVVAWRNDRWPQSPGESGTYLYSPVPRGPEQYGQFQFSVERQAHVYIQVYYALPDRSMLQRRPAWAYSRGGTQESRYQVVRRPVRV
jgi:RIO1 family